MVLVLCGPAKSLPPVDTHKSIHSRDEVYVGPALLVLGLELWFYNWRCTRKERSIGQLVFLLGGARMCVMVWCLQLCGCGIGGFLLHTMGDVGTHGTARGC